MLETRLRQTGNLGGGGGGGGSSNSAGLAGLGNLYVVTSANPVLTNSRILTAGSSVTVVTDATAIYISAITNAAGAANSAGLAGTGNYYIVGSAQPLLPGSRILTAGSSITTVTDTTAFYVTALTPNVSSFVSNTRQVLSVFPLSGGGDLTADRTFYATTAGFLVLSSRLINTTSPLGGGGNLGVDLTLTVGSLSTIGSANQFLRVNTDNATWGYINFRSGSSTVLSQASGFIQIDATTASSLMTWVFVTATAQTLSVNSGFIPNNAGLVTVTLPTTFSLGDLIYVSGYGAGGWKLNQNSGQTIHFGNVNSTVGVGGSLASTNRYDCVEVVGVITNNELNVIDAMGNITIV